MWKAKIEIGGYKVGEEVPEELAKIWNEMYVVSPTEQGDSVPIKPEPKKVESNPLDFNKDGKVNMKDAKAFVRSFKKRGKKK